MLSQRDTANLKMWMKHAKCFPNVEIVFDPDTVFKRVATEKPLPAMLKAILNRLSGVNLVQRFLEQRTAYRYLVNPIGLAAIGKMGSPEAVWERFLEDQYQPGAFTVFVKVNGDENILLVGGEPYRLIRWWLSEDITSDELREIAEALQWGFESIEAGHNLAGDGKSSFPSLVIQ